MTRGRPLRFLALVLGGWVAVRAAVLWPGDAEPPRTQRVAVSSVSKRIRPPTSEALAAPIVRVASTRLPGAGRGPVAQVLIALGGPSTRQPAHLSPGLRRGGDGNDEIPLAAAQSTATPLRSPERPPEPTAASLAGSTPAMIVPPTPALSPSSRLHGDLYFIGRPTGGNSLAFGQLGASQGGARLTYAIDDAGRVALSARGSAPLRGDGREAGLGIDIRPTALPIHLLAEARVPVDGGPARPAAQLIAGTILHLPLRLALESYAQAGGVYRRGGFADGAARLTRPLRARRGYVLDVGAGAWGAAQRRLARVDTGPTLSLTLPASGRTVRLAVDYRVRVAGRARPGSGPAVSLGASF